MFYGVRNNFAPVSKEIGAALHYDKAMIGDIPAGTAGMLSMGWLSGKLGGRRGRVSLFAMIPLLLAFAAIRVVPDKML